MTTLFHDSSAGPYRRRDGKSARRRVRRQGEVSARQIRNYDKLNRMYRKQQEAASGLMGKERWRTTEH